MRCKWIGFLGLLVVLAAPTFVRAQDDAEVTVERDLVYGKAGDTELKLDLTMPKDGKGPFPVVVCIHGGEGNGGNVSAKVIVLEGEGHAWGGEKLLKSLQQSIAFLDEHLKK